MAESSDDGEEAAAVAAEAVAAAQLPGGGRRLWYGSGGVLELWVHLLNPRNAVARAVEQVSGG